MENALLFCYSSKDFEGFSKVVANSETMLYKSIVTSLSFTCYCPVELK